METILIQLKGTSQPIAHESINTYEKGSFYCVYTTEEVVYKYPINTIFRVVEQYGEHGMKDDYEDMVKDAIPPLKEDDVI